MISGKGKSSGVTGFVYSNDLGPINEKGEARLLKTGSMSIVTESIRISTVECPSQMNDVLAAVISLKTGFTDGIAISGTLPGFFLNC